MQNAQAQNMMPRAPVESEKIARQAGLHYIGSDDVPGIRRVRHGRGFRYVDERGKPLAKRDQLARIRALAIPPAWQSVWIAADDKAHIQAVGRDQRGRKQYRYHADWRDARDRRKFGKLARFASKLPALRSRIERDLALAGLPQDKVLAAAVGLLLESHIRVGNEAYARDNGSYGLTTLRTRHAKVEGGRIELRFIGKAGKEHRIVLEDRRVARVLDSCRQLSGAPLFQFVADDGEIRAINSADVNDYLRAICGMEFSAKDVRTWAGTVMAVRALCQMAQATADGAMKPRRQLNAALRDVAQHLGNTQAICRKCYVHPGVFDLHLAGNLVSIASRAGRIPEGLDADEGATLTVLAHLDKRCGERPGKKNSGQEKS